MLKPKKNKFILGVTGNIGCGKSTIAAILKTKDAQIIDADVLAHKLYRAGSSIYRKIKKVFGEGVIKAGNRIDRVKLAKIVFADKGALTRLNNIVHPELIREINRRIKKSDKKVIILDAALIIEAGLRKMVDCLVVVTAKKSQQILRSQKNSGFNRDEVIRIMKSQISQGAKSRFADFIIDNSGSIEKTRKQVLAIRRKLWKS